MPDNSANEAAMTGGHDVVRDCAGFSSRERLTCNSSGCGKTLVRQPYMNDKVWDSLKRNFLERHPPKDPSIN